MASVIRGGKDCWLADLKAALSILVHWCRGDTKQCPNLDLVAFPFPLPHLIFYYFILMFISLGVLQNWVYYKLCVGKWVPFYFLSLLYWQFRALGWIQAVEG